MAKSKGCLNEKGREREGTWVKCAGCVAAGHAIYKRSSHDYEKYAKLFHRDSNGTSAKGSDRGRGRGGQIGAESRSSVALLNLKSTVPTLFSHVLLVLQTCSMCGSLGRGSPGVWQGGVWGEGEGGRLLAPDMRRARHYCAIKFVSQAF